MSANLECCQFFHVFKVILLHVNAEFLSTLLQMVCIFIVEASLQFTFTKNYPDELPLIEFSRSFNINDQDEQDILAGLKEEVLFEVHAMLLDSLGMG